MVYNFFIICIVYSKSRPVKKRSNQIRQQYKKYET